MNRYVFAVCAIVCNVAMAQSSVTVYGVADAGIVAESGGPAGSVTKMVGGVEGGSRLGFRGTEDLGRGVAAIFALEMGINLDTGTSAQGGVLFGRQAFVGLSSPAGALTLGRQYTPLFLSLSAVDPFQAFSTAGSAANLMSNAGIRMNNTIKYASAPVNGFNGELAYGLGEVPGSSRVGRQLGAALGYVRGPLSLRLGYANVNSIPVGPAPMTTGKTTMLGGVYDFRVVKLSLGVASNKGTVNVNTRIDPNPAAKSRDTILGVTLPVGAGNIRASAVFKHDRSPTDRNARQLGAAYNYFISKRTDVYIAYARIHNDVLAGATGFYTVGNATEAGSGNKAFNLGMRHSF
ncbi:porin [Massilia antarctica]|uniref:Porin n=1 Tax=Massilia antarctica TaxID=2765360 RepID=A0AA48W6K0_9BURK|nr:porin [Massilia antarctica]QPI47666.1 porin [Massilia antarctica]